MISTLDQVSNTMWKISRALRRTCEHSPPLRVGDTIIASPDIKANTLADNFARIHDNTQESDVETTAAVGESVHRISESCCVFQPSYLVRPKELKSFIRKLKKKKSPGSDNIRNHLLKNLPRRALIFLAKIFTACLTLGYSPDSWKNAVVVAILYPISLLPTLLKLLERTILVRLQQHLEVTNIIPNQQFGFRQGHSTKHQLVRLCQDIKAGFRQKK